MTTPTEPQRQAEVLALLLKGQLEETSAVDVGGANVPLAEYAPLAPVLQLARCIRSVHLLESPSSWIAREPEWRAPLVSKPIGRILFELSLAQATGFLSLSPSEAVVSIGLSAGLITCIQSSLCAVGIAEVLAAAGKLTADAGAKAQDVGQGKLGGLEVFLLYNGLTSPEDLIVAHGELARRRFLQFFRGARGELSFYADERAARLEDVIQRPLLALLRTGLWAGRESDAGKLKRLCAPILERPEGLTLRVPVASIEPSPLGLTDLEKTLVNAAASAQGAPSVKGLFEHLETLGDEVLSEGLRAAYLLTHIGVLGIGSGAGPAAPGPGPVAASPESPTGRTAAAQLEEYRQQRELDAEGRQLLNAGRFAEAAAKFDQLIERSERPVGALAYLAIAELLEGGRGGPDKALASAKRALELDSESALAHAAMCRALAAKKDEAAAGNHEKMSLAIYQGNEGLYREVWGLLQAGRVAVKKARPSRRKSLAGVIVVVLLALVAGYQLILFRSPNTRVEAIPDAPAISSWLVSGEQKGRGRGLPLFRGELEPGWAGLGGAEKKQIAEAMAYRLFQRGLLDAEITCKGRVAIRIARAKVVATR